MQWHWISSAICLVGMLMFAVTGFTLNHSGSLESAPQRSSVTRALPDELRAQLEPDAEAAPLPREVRRWIGRELGRHIPAQPAEWSADEVYLALPRPGGDAWLAIDRASGEFEYELTDRGTVAWLNDLHKGRNTGTAWSWFIDVFAAACLLFSLTGLFILALHARQRASVWPLVTLGAVLPALLILLF
ncbi:MAG: PepSY-associated TM helix domain-containing protein, partial [Pseudazoarcus pumilus]|nr:PepSY-associated TM helix domain-containing protein [Pseudazoarcus pumilus]